MEIGSEAEAPARAPRRRLGARRAFGVSALVRTSGAVVSGLVLLAGAGCIDPVDDRPFTKSAPTVAEIAGNGREPVATESADALVCDDADPSVLTDFNGVLDGIRRVARRRQLRPRLGAQRSGRRRGLRPLRVARALGSHRRRRMDVGERRSLGLRHLPLRSMGASASEQLGMGAGAMLFARLGRLAGERRRHRLRRLGPARPHLVLDRGPARCRFPRANRPSSSIARPAMSSSMGSWGPCPRRRRVRPAEARPPTFSRTLRSAPTCRRTLGRLGAPVGDPHSAERDASRARAAGSTRPRLHAGSDPSAAPRAGRGRGGVPRALPYREEAARSPAATSRCTKHRITQRYGR